MKRAIDALGDGWEEGVRVIGFKAPGCRHCGTKVRHVAEDGNLIVYRPGVECCYSALEDQIGFCKREIEQLNKELGEYEANVARLADDVALNEYPSRGEVLTRRLHRAEAHMPALRGQYQEKIAAVAKRVARFRELQDQLSDDLEL